MYIISSIHILIINSIFSYSFQFANNISACDCEGLNYWSLKVLVLGAWCLLLPVGLGADCWATELETWILFNAWLLATELVIWIWDNKNIYVLYCNACCYYNATVAFACLNWCNAVTIMLLLLVWIDVWIGAKIRGGTIKICYWMSCCWCISKLRFLR